MINTGPRYLGGPGYYLDAVLTVGVQGASTYERILDYAKPISTSQEVEFYRSQPLPIMLRFEQSVTESARSHSYSAVSRYSSFAILAVLVTAPASASPL